MATREETIAEKPPGTPDANKSKNAEHGGNELGVVCTLVPEHKAKSGQNEATENGEAREKTTLKKVSKKRRRNIERGRATRRGK